MLPNDTNWFNLLWPLLLVVIECVECGLLLGHIPSSLTSYLPYRFLEVNLKSVHCLDNHSFLSHETSEFVDVVRLLN